MKCINLTRNIEMFGLNVKEIIGEEIRYEGICLYTNSKYKLSEIDIIFDSIQELKEYLSFPYKVETYKGFDIYRRLINEDDIKVSYYFRHEIYPNYNRLTRNNANINRTKNDIDYLINNYNLIDTSIKNKTTTIITKGSVNINSENGITTVTINE